MSLRESLDAILKRAADAGDVPGVVAVLTDREKTLYEGAFGKRKLGAPEDMTVDTVGLIASMTKAITSLAAMQLVEQGKLELDSPASRWLPDLGKLQVLEAFDGQGTPRMRAPKRPITLRHLLTHTAGFSYEFLSQTVQKVKAATDIPAFTSSEYASLKVPLLFDPGDRYEYGINTDWAGLLVQQASGMKLSQYLRKHVLGPLGMKDTDIVIRPDMRRRLASIHARAQDGSLTPIDLELPQQPETEMGGQALYGTAPDYLRFVRMLLNGGQGPNGRLLKPETVGQMSTNQIGALDVPTFKSADRALFNDLPMPEGNPQKWSLAFLINTKAMPTGRAPGSMMWAGICNSYYWIDPTTGIGGVYLTQILPFADVKSMPLFQEFETAAYRHHR